MKLSRLLCCNKWSRDFFYSLWISGIPLRKAYTCCSHSFTKRKQEVRNLTFQNGSQFFPHFFFSLYVASI